MAISKRVILCEGAAGSFLPTSAFCRQQDKVWFAYGKPTGLNESFEGMRIVESLDDMDLEERRAPDGTQIKMPKDGIWVVEGPAQDSDKRNANNRYYPREIWEKWIKDAKSPAQQAIRERAMVGHLEHPGDGRTDGNKLAMVVTLAELREDGRVHARFELLDTPEGQRLQEYTRKRVKWGVSSRGAGSVDEKGRVSPSDYVLETWDAVMRPSVRGAHPLPQSESTETPVRSSESEPVAVVETALDGHSVAALAKVESLCGTAIGGLDETDRLSLRRSLVKAVASMHAMPANKRVCDALMASVNVLNALAETESVESLDDLIETACREATNSDDDDLTASTDAEAIHALRRSHEATAVEAEELRTKLEGAESALQSAQAQIAELTEQLAEATQVYASTDRRLVTAEALLAEGSTRDVSGPVLEAVNDAVRQVAALEAFRVVLERAESVDQVYDFAELLLPVVTRSKAPVVEHVDTTPIAPVPAVNSRPTLPRGVVRSESDATERITESRAKPTSRGASLAARALAGKS